MNFGCLNYLPCDMMKLHLYRYGFTRLFSSFNFVNNAKSSHFSCEAHEVITEDGYILTLHRLLSKEVNLHHKIPVLLQHGLWSSSEDWIVSGPTKSIGYILAEAGFDVWFGNTRGNHYSRRHVKYSPFKDAKEFWDFSWHEMGYFDLPAMIDYVLKWTARKNLYCIGHSQGTTSFFVLGSTKPEYSSKIKAIFALAPVAYLRHMRNEHLLKLASIQQPLFVFLTSIGSYKLVPQEHMLSALDKLWSQDFDKHSAKLLKNLSNYATTEVKQNLKSILMSHVSCGTSLKVLAHFAQCTIEGKKFRQFDYGPSKNVQVYGKSNAPAYNLKSISIPLVLFYSDGDWLTHPKDIECLVQELPDNILLEKVNQPRFNHLDFLWADFREFSLYDRFLQHVNVFEACK